jgi:YggT family protein
MCRYAKAARLSARTISMSAFLHVVDLALAIYIWLLLATAVLYWLVEFNRLDRGRPGVARVAAALSAVTEPVLRPIRRVLPDLGGVDISPVVAIVLVAAIRYTIALFILPRLL